MYFGYKETGNTSSKGLSVLLKCAKDLVAKKECRKGLFSKKSRVDFLNLPGERVSWDVVHPIEDGRLGLKDNGSAAHLPENSSTRRRHGRRTEELAGEFELDDSGH